MIKLKSLTFSGIGRFVEPQTIDFTALGNLVQVDAENRNTGGSSGSGKSTVFNALDYLLGVNDLPTTVLQSRLTKESISVTGNFDLDGKDLAITRSKKGLAIDLAGDTVGGSSKLSEERLDELLGMPRELFRKILHKRQKEGGFFLDFTPKKMYDFLTDCLNLGSERKKLETIEEKLKVLTQQRNTVQTDLNLVQSALNATHESILALGMPPIRDIHQQVILDLKGKYDASSKTYKEVEGRHKGEIQILEAQRPQIEVTRYPSEARQGFEQRIQQINESIRSRLESERSRQDRVKADIASKTIEKTKLGTVVHSGIVSKKLAVEVAGHVRKIRESVCPTCEQHWVTDKAKLTEAQYLAQIAECKGHIQAGAAGEARIAELDAEIELLKASLVPQYDPELPKLNEELASVTEKLIAEKKAADLHVADQNLKNKGILNAFADAQETLRIIHSQEMEQYRGQLEVDRKAFEIAAMKLQAYSDAKTRYDAAKEAMQNKIAEHEGMMAIKTRTYEELHEEIETAEELKRIVKSFISCSFDDALESIGEASTKLIRCIPTMSNATIQFESLKETKDGKVKEEVNAVISMDGDIGIPIKSLSGGERSSVDLAVDLSVIDFIESQTGKGIDIFILDEPFTGLDTVSIEMALEVLKNSNMNKKLIVVDHNPEVKQMVSNRLVVVRDGNTSSITSEGN